MKVAVAALASLWVTTAAAGQLAANDAPIDFRAEYMEFFDAENRLHCSVNVRATQGDIRLLADRLDVHFYEGEDGKPRSIKSIVAEGAVTYITPTEVARADRGAYESATGMVVLSGNVEVSGGSNVMSGERIAFRPEENLSLAQSMTGARLVIGARPRAATAVLSEE